MEKVNIIPLLRSVPDVPTACAMDTAAGRGCFYCAVNVLYHHQNIAILLSFILVLKCYTLGEKKWLICKLSCNFLLCSSHT